MRTTIIVFLAGMTFGWLACCLVVKRLTLRKRKSQWQLKE